MAKVTKHVNNKMVKQKSVESNLAMINYGVDELKYYAGKCPLSSIKLNYDFHSRFGDIWGERGWTRAPIFLAGKKNHKDAS